MKIIEKYIQLQTKSEKISLTIEELKELVFISNILKEDKNRGNEEYNPISIEKDQTNLVVTNCPACGCKLGVEIL